METGIFAAGCFWKPDLEFEKLKGVEKTEVGCCGGNNPNTTYENVCTGTTDHAEVVKVYYDENVITYEIILRAIEKHTSEGRLYLLETLANKISDSCFSDSRIKTIDIQIEKLDRIKGSLGIRMINKNG